MPRARDFMSCKTQPISAASASVTVLEFFFPGWNSNGELYRFGFNLADGESSKSYTLFS